MIKITEEMKNISNKRFEELCSMVDERISHAVENGRCSACFPIDKHDEHYERIKKEYEANGYKIKPTGYIGGVWQLTEYITWQR